MFEALKRLFARERPQQLSEVRLMSGGSSLSASFDGNLRESDVFVSAVHSIATHASKMSISHGTIIQGTRGQGDQQINRLLNLQPNPISTAAEFLYKCASIYWTDANLFILLERSQDGSIQALWPLKPTSGQFITDQSNMLYIRFLFSSGQTVILPYSDIVHIRRMFHGNDLLGDSNAAITPVVGLATAQTEGLKHNIDSGGTIRGILKYLNNLNPKDIEEQRQKFINVYLKQGGSTIAAIDAKVDYQPIHHTPITINADEIKAISEKVFSFLGVNSAIVDGSFTEDQYSAFVESSLEPFANALSQALTVKLFTEREINWGNQILVDTAGRMAFASQKTKITALKELMPLGLLTYDQALSVLGFPMLGGEEGAKRIQSLNYCDSNLVSEYQLNGIDKKLLKGDEPNEGN